jgi:hypothetical protein
MPEGSLHPLNPAPRSLLDQFLQELADLGLSEEAVNNHLIWLRIWQKFLAPARLLDGEPTALEAFEQVLQCEGVSQADVAFAREAVEHFYAFTLDLHAGWPARAPWAVWLEQAPGVKSVPLWRAIAKKMTPHLRRVDEGRLRWGRP